MCGSGNASGMLIQPPTTESTARTASGAHMMAGDSEQGDRVYESGLEEHPGDFMLNFDYAFALSMHERWEESIRYFMRCIAIRSDVAGVWRGLGNSYLKHDEPARGIAALTKACEIEPRHGPTFVDLAEALFDHGELDAAMEQAANASKLVPSKAAPHGIMGRVLMKHGKYEEALPRLETCHSLGKEDRTWTGPTEKWLNECREHIQKHD